MAAAHSSPAPSAADPPARSHVRDFMQLGLSHCAPDDDLSAVARTMAEQRVHSVVVAGIACRDHAGEHLGWGIVTDMDLMCALRPGAGDPTAGEVAGTEIVTISPRDSLEQAVQTMAEHDAAHLVVVSPETGRPVGMLSSLDAQAVTSA